MIAVDTSVLAFAINRHAPGHTRAAELVDALANGERPWCLPWPAVHEFVERVTHPHAVARPLRAADAWAFVGSLATSASLRFHGPTARHAEVAAEVLALAPEEPRVPPAFELAVVLREHGVREVLSADRSLRRYRFLEVRDPIHGERWTGLERPGRRYRVLSRAGPPTP